MDHVTDVPSSPLPHVYLDFTLTSMEVKALTESYAMDVDFIGSSVVVDSDMDLDILEVDDGSGAVAMDIDVDYITDPVDDMEVDFDFEELTPYFSYVMSPLLWLDTVS
ncbi:hypothetical protein VKT23_020066 [Stygiomarasmius scandens]|uniref:Uncharacterized protein n=1 Tax=Marasmiellus scandens TaxID=2682957 RepID=A0ABR1INJ2_9AGAR